jgi:hypothetical protein
MAIHSDAVLATMDIGTRAQLWDGLNSQKKFFFGNKIYELAPDEHPFLTMLGRIPKISIDGPDKSYIEHRSATINAPVFHYTSGTLTFTAGTPGTAYTSIVLHRGTAAAAGAVVLTGADIAVGDLIQFVNENDKSQFANMICTEVTTGTDVDLTLLTNAPGWNPTGGATNCYKRGSIFGEGSAASTQTYELLDTKWMGTSIFKNMYEISGTLEATKDLVYGSELETQMKMLLRRHMSDQDKAFLHASSRVSATAGDPFDAPATTLVNGVTTAQRVPSTISLYQACRSQSSSTYGLGGTRLFTNTASTMTYGDLLDNLQEQFEFQSASDTKVAFAGAGFLTSLNKLALRSGEYKLSAGETSFGLKCNILDSPHGQLQIIRHIGMRDEWSNAMAVIDPANIALCDFRPTSWRGLPITTDARQVEYLTEAGLMVRLPETHGFWFFL